MLDADRLAVQVRAALDRVLVPLARVAHAIHRRRAWTVFGYARCDDYARERASRSGRWLRDLAAIGRAIEGSPGFERALTGEDGGPPLGRAAAVLVAGVASEGLLGAWIDCARRSTVRGLRAAIGAARAAGTDAPAHQETSAGDAEGSVHQEDEGGARHRIRFTAPLPVLAAVDEAVDLHRAVTGREAPATELFEALVAEAWAGPSPPLAEVAPVERRPRAAAVESALERATDGWAALSGGGPYRPESALGFAQLALERLEAVSRRAGSGDAVELDEQMRALVRLEDELERGLGSVLAELGDRGAWATLMFRGAGHYAEERLGVARTTATDRARLHRALRRYPRLARAYASGEIGSQSAAVVLRALAGRAVDPELERAWIERAREATVKRLHDEAREIVRCRYGDPPSAPEPCSSGGIPTPMGDVSGTRPLEDARWYASLRRDPGRSRARLMRWAEACLGPGVSEGVFAVRLPEPLARSFAAAIEARRRDLARLADSAAWCEPSWPPADAPVSLRAARTFSTRGGRVPAWVGLLGLVEDYVATWDPPATRAGRRAAEATYRRDGWRCAAPGCTSRRNLEEHHVLYRSRGGGNERSNRLCLCRFHHRLGEHGRLARCRGRAPLGVRWRLGAERVATWFQNERRLPRLDVRTGVALQ